MFALVRESRLLMQYAELLLAPFFLERGYFLTFYDSSETFPHKKIVYLFVEFISMFNQCRVT